MIIPESASSGARPVEVERQQVQLREGDVLGPQHERQHEVAEHAGDGRDHEEEDHDHAVQREHPVVGVRAHDGRAGREQLDPQRHREDAAQQEGEQHRDQVHDADPLVIDGGEPRPDAPIGVQVVHRRRRPVFGVIGAELVWLAHRSLPSRGRPRDPAAQRLDELDQRRGVGRREPPLVGRHHRLEALHDLPARVDHRIGEVGLVGDDRSRRSRGSPSGRRGRARSGRCAARRRASGT